MALQKLDGNSTNSYFFYDSESDLAANVSNKFNSTTNISCFFLDCIDWQDRDVIESCLKAVVLSAMTLLTIAGNTLVLAAVFISRSLRSSTHYLIVNLAAADLLLGTTVLPFSTVREISGKWYFGDTFCDVWAAVDVLCCTASIWSLCVISIDRYIGVTRPLGYNTIVTERRVCALMVGVWALSVAVSIGPMFGWQAPASPDPYVCTVNNDYGYVLFSVTFSFYLPGFCIIVLYWRIFRTACRQSNFLESGTKMTNTSVTLRVHKGGSSARCSTTDLTQRVKRGGSLPNSTHNLAVAPSIDALRRRSDNCVGAADCMLNRRSVIDARRMSHLEVSTTLWQSGNRSNRSSRSNSRRSSKSIRSSRLDMSCRSSSSSSPERRLNVPLPGKLAKFRRQQKAAKTLGIVVGVFLLCWFPFFFILPLSKYEAFYFF